MLHSRNQSFYDEAKDLASGLQHSNVEEVAKLAKAFLLLQIEYVDLLEKLFKKSSEEVLRKHGNLLRRLKDHE